MRRFVLLFAVLMLIPAGVASAAELSETIDRTLDVQPGGAVVLTNVNGRITVGSWDQPRVRVVARKEVHADRDDVAAVMRELRVEIQPRDGGVTITTHHPRHTEGLHSIFDWLLGDGVSAEVRYEVTLPRRMNVQVTNTNGAIELRDVSGRLRLDTTNGKIEVAGCSGSLAASTTNGGIDAELVAVTSGQDLRFETTNGRIEVALPASLGADVDADTTNGSIRTDLPISTTQLSRTSLRGKINGGGTALRLRTTNGGIQIRVAGRS